jgi:hypothetical protein
LWVNAVKERRMKQEMKNNESDSGSIDNNDSDSQETRDNNGNDGRQ